MNGPLDKSWRDQIWLPHLTFSNTKGNSPLSVDESGDDSIVVEVIRNGSQKLNDPADLYEGYTFHGNENHLRLFALHQIDFQCSFELSQYPFDTQKCSIDIQVPLEIKDYIALLPESLKYSGNFYINISLLWNFKDSDF